MWPFKERCNHTFDEIKTDTIPSAFQQIQESSQKWSVDTASLYMFQICLVKTWKCNKCGQTKVTEHKNL